MEFVMEPFMWLGIVALFLVIEAVTVGLTTIWFAGGALVAAVASGLGASQAVQWILFFAVSVIGEKAVVIQKISNLDQTGQVKVGDVEWMARTESDEMKIPEKAVVVIKEVQGVKLIVEEVKEG